MNATVYTAHVTASHRAATLDRENEILRRQAERTAAAGPSIRRPARLAVVADWIGSHLRLAAIRSAH